MKKYLIAFSLLMYSFAASAETIIVVDGNGVVQKQIVTETITQTTTYPYQTVSVVTQSPRYTDSYYYDNSSTGAALAAGITTGIIGTLLFSGINHHHHKKAPVVIHHGGGKHHGGHSSHKHH